MMLRLVAMVPGHIALLMFRPLAGSGIAGIGEHRLLASAQQHAGLVDIGLVGGGANGRVRQKPEREQRCFAVREVSRTKLRGWYRPWLRPLSIAAGVGTSRHLHNSAL